MAKVYWIEEVLPTVQQCFDKGISVTDTALITGEQLADIEEVFAFEYGCMAAFMETHGLETTRDCRFN